MRVLFFNYEYPPLGAGAANATFFILKEYAHIPDLQVDFITSSCDEQFHLEKIEENIFVHKLPIGKNEKNLHYQSNKDLLTYAWKAYFYSWKLIRRARKEKKPYDLTHSFFSVPCGFISMLFRYQYELPYIVSLRGSDVPGYSERFSLLYSLLKPVIIFIWKKAGAVMANSAVLRELAVKSNKKQEIGIIYNGINIDIFKPDKSKRPEGKFIVTTGATRVTTRKNISSLVRAIHKLSPRYPELEAKIMGEGDDMDNLKRLVKELKLEDRVKLLGRIHISNLFPYYQEASAFVLPSLNEGMSNAMLEALGAGLPIIMTPTGGAEELIKDGVNGYIVRFKESDDIAEKLEKLLTDPELREKMGEESRKIAESMSWKSVAEKYFELYKKVKNNG